LAEGLKGSDCNKDINDLWRVGTKLVMIGTKDEIDSSVVERLPSTALQTGGVSRSTNVYSTCPHTSAHVPLHRK
jgi:hypothetical protein